MAHESGHDFLNEKKILDDGVTTTGGVGATSSAVATPHRDPVADLTGLAAIDDGVTGEVVLVVSNGTLYFLD